MSFVFVGWGDVTVGSNQERGKPHIFAAKSPKNRHLRQEPDFAAALGVSVDIELAI
jgi:hypothetical protein